MNATRVLSFDPGGITGYCWITALPDKTCEWEAGNIFGEENDQVDEMVAWVEEFDPHVIVIEDFRVRMIQKKDSFLSPVRITAAFRYALHLRAPKKWGKPKRIVIQDSGNVFHTMTDARLKAAGFWTPGKYDHPRAATKHALYYLRGHPPS